MGPKCESFASESPVFRIHLATRSTVPHPLGEEPGTSATCASRLDCEHQKRPKFSLESIIILQIFGQILLSIELK